MSSTISNVLTSILAVCALIVTRLVVRSEFFGQQQSAVREPEVPMVEEWQSVAANGHIRGPGDAPVKIVVFSDFQCPFCARMPPVLEEVRARHPQKVAVSYRHLPLDMHEQAFAAAVASECAARQNRFWPYHDLLYENQKRLASAPWDSLAAAAGIPNREAFGACVEQEDTTEQVRSDRQRALDLGVDSTPTVIVNGSMRGGALSIEALEAQVQEAASQAEQDK
jgi:protein-disulfide isomerase